ncbi:hypothetical protein AB0F81_22030 [Actinoplanes sp. NPDC024001]|uniref:hypothetical protein n=1 Tax=Actinoplanes sp. NPDC024001 TaxID=3154598 RepID=UPI0033D80DA8
MSSPTGPFDQWLTPRREMSWRPGSAAISEPIAKLGGQPFWLDEPFWPVSASSGDPMTFIGQFPAPGGAALAYLFLSDADGSYDPDGGENALIVQPGGRIPSFLKGENRRTGPSLWRRGTDWNDRVPVELHIDLRPPDPATLPVYERQLAEQDAERRGEPLEPDENAYLEKRDYLGGRPVFWQPWAVEEIGESWRFFFQLDGAEGSGDDAFALPYGGGTGYAFLSEDQREGRFFWDCA